jgi:hypothetical protein
MLCSSNPKARKVTALIFTTEDVWNHVGNPKAIMFIRMVIKPNNVIAVDTIKIHDSENDNIEGTQSTSLVPVQR